MQGQKIAVKGKKDTYRLRAYVGRNEKGSPQFLSETFHGGSRAADDALAALIKKVDGAKARSATGAETVSDLLDRFIEHANSLGRSPTTTRKYRQIADAVLVPELGSIRLEKLTALDLDKLYATLTKEGVKGKGNKATTVRRVHALIGAALAQAVKWDAVESNVSLKATPPPVQRAEIVVPDPDQVDAIIAAAEAIEPSLSTLLFLQAIVGARRGEMCGLRWSDLDWQRRTLSITGSVYEVKGGGVAEKDTKTHAARVAVLGAGGMELLRRHRAHVDALAAEVGATVAPDAFMFSRSPAGSEPVRPDYVTKFATKVNKKAGVIGTQPTHGMRHFVGTQALAAGIDPKTIAERLGHADASMLLRTYAHVVPARRLELANAIEGTLSLPVPAAEAV